MRRDHHNERMVASPPRGASRRLVAPVLTRIVVGVVAALTTMALLAGPAGADPPAPTDFRSEVDRVVPEVDGVRASVVGGDGFLVIEVDEGIEVDVPGYGGEPYVRFRADGTVEENLRSPARYLNEDRDGNVEPPPDADGDAEPEWEVVADDGRWAWHDHRIHYMGGGDPPRRVVEWEVPITVDGEEVVIHGSYRRLAAPSPLPWVALAAVVTLALVLGATRVLPPLTVSGAAILLGAVAAVAVGVAERGASPPGAPTTPLVVVLPVLAVVAGVIVVMQRGKTLRGIAGLAGTALLAGWALTRLGVLTHAVLPTSLAPDVDRAVTAVAIGVAVAAAVLIVRSGALAPDLPPVPPTHDAPSPRHDPDEA